MNAALLAGVLLASLAGSLHCAGMCGGFVAFYTGSSSGSGRSSLPSHAAYSFGRLLTYLGFGLLAGWLGALLDLAGDLAGLRRGAALAAGALVIGWGLIALASAAGRPIPGLRPPRRLQAVLRRAHAAAAARPPLLRALLVGLLTTLLPCGWLHAFTLTAAGTGGPLSGMAVMLAFWIGTLPVLLGLGLGVQALSLPFRRRLPLVSALVILAVGLSTLAGRGPSLGVGAPATPPACHVDG